MTGNSADTNNKRTAKRSGRVTIDDVARIAGVSTATVSRALNTPNAVSKALRENIDQAITTAGYIPSGAARALASNRSYTIGAIIPTLKNAIFSASMAAFEQTLSESNYTLLITVSNYDRAHETVQLQKLIERDVDAVLLVGLDHSRRAWQLLEQSKTPALAIWGSKTTAAIPNIGFDNVHSGGLMAQHLLELGHHRIGYISGICKHNDRSILRLKGIKSVLSKAGMELDPELFLESRFSHADGRRAFTTLMDHPNPPTAIMCGNDVLAMGAMFEAHSRSIRIPEDVSITGFDNLPITVHLKPALTTIDVPSEQMGTQAARGIIDYLANQVPIHSQLLPAPLLTRETTQQI